MNPKKVIKTLMLHNQSSKSFRLGVFLKRSTQLGIYRNWQIYKHNGSQQTLLSDREYKRG